jgi:hypothetical protein
MKKEIEYQSDIEISLSKKEMVICNIWEKDGQKIAYFSQEIKAGASAFKQRQAKIGSYDMVKGEWREKDVRSNRRAAIEAAFAEVFGAVTGDLTAVLLKEMLASDVPLADILAFIPESQWQRHTNVYGQPQNEDDAKWHVLFEIEMFGAA